MPAYELTPEAEADLEGIAEYTLREWGAEQQARYAALLEAGFIRRRFSEHYSHVFVTRCEHHYVFYIRPEGTPVPRILAVLHERMNLIARLRDRLER